MLYSTGGNHSYGDEWYRNRKPFIPGEMCPMCEGFGRWHATDGSTCSTVNCEERLTVCSVCNATGRLPAKS